VSSAEPPSPDDNSAQKNSSVEGDSQKPGVRVISMKENEKLWDEIGFHKPLAGFWYKLALGLISMVIGLVILTVWYTFFYPFPESMGYKTTATGIFVLFFSIMDIGTNMCQERFIAEARIKNPAKMIQYIQYFIWYQMMTGLIQTTAVSIYALYIVPKTELSYAVWIMLIQSTTQYPGFLGVFRGVLTSMQHFDKAEILNFIAGEVFQRITEVIFLLWGRFILGADPRFGEIMGIAIGAMIGLYIDDFFAMALSAYYFQALMKHEGITVKRCFQIEFDWQLVKETFLFGFKTAAPGLIGLVAELIILWEWIAYVPQYTTFVTLFGMIGGISGLMGYAMGVNITPAISESFLNGKQTLTKYYIGQYARFSGIVQLFMLSLVLVVASVLEPAFIALGLANYVLAVPFLLPRVLREIQQPYTSLADTIMIGTNHPTVLMLVRFGEEIFKVVFMTLFIVVLKLPQTYGLAAIIWVMPCGIYPAILFKTITLYIYINRNIMKLDIPFWQAHGAPAIACIAVFLIMQIVRQTIFMWVWNAYGIIPAIIVMLLFLLGILTSVFFPLTGALGAWDDSSLRDFQKAAKMSGPSKPLVYPMYFGAYLGAKMSPLHNRFGMDSKIAFQEAQELMEIKHSHYIK
jgi:O-antigen/teichoic acid export membrane protein